MKRREHNAMPDEFLKEFQNGTSDSREKAKRVWELLGTVESDSLNIPTTDDALKDLSARIGEGSFEPVRARDRAPVARKRKVRLRQSVFSFVAACCVFLIGVMGYLSVPVTHHTTPGEKALVQLPDGSEVFLNNESSIQYKRSFRQWYGAKASERIVQLDGEAFLVVAKDGRPFKVNTFNAEVTVLGTAFNVRAYSVDADAETRITLDHGSVQVDAVSGNDQTGVILNEKGQQAVVKKSSLEKMDANNQARSLEWITSWRTDGFVAMGLSLEALVGQIERHYATEIGISEELSLTPMDLIYPTSAPAIEQILSDFCISERCSFRKTGSGYFLIPSE